MLCLSDPNENPLKRLRTFKIGNNIMKHSFKGKAYIYVVKKKMLEKITMFKETKFIRKEYSHFGAR